LTSGTVLHDKDAADPVVLGYLMTTGVSVLLLQRQLGLRRYETAWMMLHKLRRATVNLAREPLRGEVESDERYPRLPNSKEKKRECVVNFSLDQILARIQYTVCETS
jgi:hypothetical protein